MSALSGFWDWSGDDAPVDCCGAMLAAQRRYGPDRQDFWACDELAIGRALYKLLPEDEHDRQPLHGSGGSIVLVADVRLDNRDDLLARLGYAGPQGAVLSDANVLLLAFEQWGVEFLDHLNGDFALAIWDARKQSLILARDPLGQRPLYYHSSPRFFAFASMPAGLHALPAIPRRPRMETLADFVGLVPIKGSRGFYEGIERVEPGHVVTVSRSGIESRRYWTPQPRNLHIKTFDEYKEAFRAELDRSVRIRLRGAGGYVGSHLSGGWDSSSVTATTARLLAPDGSRVRAYTSVPRLGGAFAACGRVLADESGLAAAVAGLYPNVDHVLIPGAAKSPIADLDRYVAAFDRPVYNLANHVWITDIREDLRAQGIKLVLTGEIGNWTISSAPYTVLADYIRQGCWLDWLHEARALSSSRSARLRGIAANSFGPWLPQWAWNMVRPLSSRGEAAIASALNPSLVNELDRRREAEGVGLARRPKNYYEAVSAGLMDFDHGDLRKGALAGWASDERDPTADRQLIEFCLSLPIDMILKDGVRRPLARAALSDRLPAAVLNEKRKGQQAADWHEGMTNSRPEMRALLEEMAGNDMVTSLVDIGSLRHWLRDWPEGGWDDPVVTDRYRRALPIALTAGHFILSTTR